MTEPNEQGAPSTVRTILDWARWTWRQLTSMRVALVLLLLLALAAIPGSIVPQRGLNPIKVADFYIQHPAEAPWFNRLGLFDVFSAPWFAAIYLLLFISLAGCVIPRARVHLTAMRSRPPEAPRRLDRLPVWRQWETEASVDEAVAAGRTALKSRRFRIVDGHESVAAEKGYLHETGNLLFHTSLLLLLFAVGVGSLFGYKGNVVVVEGQGFSNTVTSFDSFSQGRLFNVSNLAPISFTLSQFNATYQTTGQQKGQPESFDAHVTWTASPGAKAQTDDIQVNHPLESQGTKIYLLGHGYAPVFTVKDGKGTVVYSGPTPFLPQDSAFTSTGVVKVPDAQPTQLGFQGFFLPTTVIDPKLGPISVFPQAILPTVVLSAWSGDLGLDNGVPQSVYLLNTAKMKEVGIKGLGVGATWTLPNKLGSITFDGYKQYGTFQVSHDPGKTGALFAAILALVGLILSLSIRRRRVWVRAASIDGRTVVTVAGLSRTEGGDLDSDVDAVANELQLHASVIEATSDSDPGDSTLNEPDSFPTPEPVAVSAHDEEI